LLNGEREGRIIPLPQEGGGGKEQGDLKLKTHLLLRRKEGVTILLHLPPAGKEETKGGV